MRSSLPPGAVLISLSIAMMLTILAPPSSAGPLRATANNSIASAARNYWPRKSKHSKPARTK
jgi:hypothetical protein